MTPPAWPHGTPPVNTFCCNPGAVSKQFLSQIERALVVFLQLDVPTLQPGVSELYIGHCWVVSVLVHKASGPSHILNKINTYSFF